MKMMIQRMFISFLSETRVELVESFETEEMIKLRIQDYTKKKLEENFASKD